MRDRAKYISRKMLRWFGGIFLILFGVFGLAAIGTISSAVALVLFVVGLAILGASLRASEGHLAKAGESILATFATLLGVLKGMRGQTMATWTPAKSR